MCAETRSSVNSMNMDGKVDKQQSTIECIRIEEKRGSWMRTE